jgi:hypothetical protein
MLTTLWGTTPTCGTQRYYTRYKHKLALTLPLSLRTCLWVGGLPGPPHVPCVCEKVLRRYLPDTACLRSRPRVEVAARLWIRQVPIYRRGTCTVRFTFFEVKVT